MTSKLKLTAEEARKLSGNSNYVELIADQILEEIEKAARKGGCLLNVAFNYGIMEMAFRGLQGDYFEANMHQFDLKNHSGVGEVSEAIMALGYSVTDHEIYHDFLIIEW